MFGGALLLGIDSNSPLPLAGVLTLDGVDLVLHKGAKLMAFMCHFRVSAIYQDMSSF
jgi:hypothetical protein